MKTLLLTLLFFASVNIAKAQITTINATLADPCSTLHINENLLEDNISIFPNPTDGLVNVYFENKNISDKISIKIYDMIGKLIFEKMDVELINNSFSINLENLTSGIYFINIQRNNKSTSKKLIINK